MHSSLSKIFERIILNRIISLFEQNNILISTQFGFRHNHSTLHPILDSLTDCLDNIQNKNFSTLILLDIKKAFDSVCHKKLIKKLDFYGIRGVANDLLQSYLNNRFQFVAIGNANSNLKKIEYGVTQDSILGPLLFLIFINDLPKCLHSVPRLFADERALLISDATLPKMEKLANDELSNIKQWMRSNNLTLHPHKILALYISPFSRKSSPNFTLTLDADQISISDTAKYIGLLVNDQLSFKNHIALLENKISRSVGIMYKLSYYLP